MSGLILWRISGQNSAGSELALGRFNQNSFQKLKPNCESFALYFLRGFVPTRFVPGRVQKLVTIPSQPDCSRGDRKSVSNYLARLRGCLGENCKSAGRPRAGFSRVIQHWAGLHLISPCPPQFPGARQSAGSKPRGSSVWRAPKS